MEKARPLQGRGAVLVFGKRLVLAAGFYGLPETAAQGGPPVTVVGVAHYLAVINGVLAVRNLVPEFRSMVGAWSGPRRGPGRRSDTGRAVADLVLSSTDFREFVSRVSRLTGREIGTDSLGCTRPRAPRPWRGTASPGTRAFRPGPGDR